MKTSFKGTMRQSAAEIFNIVEGWKNRCPQEFFTPGTNILKQEYETLLDKVVQEKFGGFYSRNNLDIALVYVLLSAEHKAALAAMQHDFKRQLEEEAWKKRVKEVQTWVDSHPNCKQDDQAIAVIREFFTKNPNATIAEWDAYTLQHPDDKRLWNDPKPLVLDVRNKTGVQLQEMRRVYGDAPVQKALDELAAAMKPTQTWQESPSDVAERHKRESAEAKARDKAAQEQAEAKAEAAANSIVQSFRGQTHSESFRVRPLLANILIYKSDNSGKVDWQATAAKRAEYVANYEHENAAVINRLAR